MPYVSESDIQWLASAIDGEGSIVVNKRTAVVQVVVYNTNRTHVKRAAQLMGSKIYERTYGKDKILYSAYTNRRMTALKILKQVEPFLKIKQIKALTGIRIILDYYDIADISLRAFPNLP